MFRPFWRSWGQGKELVGVEAGHGAVESGQPRPPRVGPAYSWDPNTQPHREGGSLGSGLMQTYRVCMREIPARVFKKWVAVAVIFLHLLSGYH